MRMPFVVDDGGRAEAGFKGNAGDCVTRAVAIVTGLPYRQVYDLMAAGNQGERRTKRSHRATGRRTAREGIDTNRKWFKELMLSLGFVWTPTMLVGSGCKVHLGAGELPHARLVVAVSRHYTAVVYGTIRDTHDPQRFTINPDAFGEHVASRCVYGYWTFNPQRT